VNIMVQPAIFRLLSSFNISATIDAQEKKISTKAA